MSTPVRSRIPASGTGAPLPGGRQNHRQPCQLQHRGQHQCPPDARAPMLGQHGHPVDATHALRVFHGHARPRRRSQEIGDEDRNVRHLQQSGWKQAAWLMGLEGGQGESFHHDLVRFQQPPFVSAHSAHGDACSFLGRHRIGHEGSSPHDRQRAGDKALGLQVDGREGVFHDDRSAGALDQLVQRGALHRTRHRAAQDHAGSADVLAGVHHQPGRFVDDAVTASSRDRPPQCLRVGQRGFPHPGSVCSRYVELVCHGYETGRIAVSVPHPLEEETR